MTTNSAPKWYKPVTIVALLWNLVGVMAFFMEVNKSDEAIAMLSESERLVYANMPIWVNVAFAVAVFGGTIGSLGLVLKKGWSVPVLVISLIAVLLQMGYSYTMIDTDRVGGHGSAFMPILVIIIGIALVVLSRKAARSGWLS